MENSNKTIASNTIFLYIRSILVLFVSLFTMRVILRVLGIDDYGLFTVIAGTVAIFAVLNNSMSAVSQRFLSFELGDVSKGNPNEVFNISVFIHCCIGVLVIFLCETVGLWFIKNNLNIPPDRINACLLVYHFSVLTFFVNIIKVPFVSLVIANEKMKFFAYGSILEVGLKLFVAYFISFTAFDKLILYAMLLFFVSIVILIIHIYYCRISFRESRIKLFSDRTKFREMLMFSGWSLFGNLSATLQIQGSNILLNIFFGTIVNAAYGISLQVNAAVRTLINNFQTALNPQIVKAYSINNSIYFYSLILRGSKFSFLLTFVLITPLFFFLREVLYFWLGSVPNYTVELVELTLIFLLIESISGSLMMSVRASGKIKIYQIIIGGLLLLNLPLSYLSLKSFSKEPQTVLLVSILISFFALTLRLIYVRRFLKLSLKRFLSEVFMKILIVILPSIFLSYIVIDTFFYSNGETLGIFKVLFGMFLVFSFCLLFTYTLGLSKREKLFIVKFVKRIA